MKENKSHDLSGKSESNVFYNNLASRLLSLNVKHMNWNKCFSMMFHQRVILMQWILLEHPFCYIWHFCHRLQYIRVCLTLPTKLYNNPYNPYKNTRSFGNDIMRAS